MEELSHLHPYIVHFPVALLITYVFVELLSVLIKKDFLSKSAHLILFLGIIGAVAAVLTGNQAYNAFGGWNKESLKIFNEHQYYANLSLWYFLGLLILRTYLVIKNKFNLTFRISVLILAILGAYFIFRTGYYGGELVNRFGVNKEIRLQIENK